MRVERVLGEGSVLVRLSSIQMIDGIKYARKAKRHGRTYCRRSICPCDDIDSICMFASLFIDLLWVNSKRLTLFPNLQLAWLITFIASLIADVRGDFPNFAWWAIAYLFCTIVGVFIVVGSDSTHTYHVAVSALSRFETRTMVTDYLDRLSGSWQRDSHTPLR